LCDGEVLNRFSASHPHAKSINPYKFREIQKIVPGQPFSYQSEQLADNVVDDKAEPL
jgi:hypothetical protein